MDKQHVRDRQIQRGNQSSLTRITAVLGASLMLSLALPLSAFGHSHSRSEQRLNCTIYGEHTHGTGAEIDATTVHTNGICEGVEAKARWKVDGAWYIDIDTDTSGVLVAVAGMSSGFDIFSSSDHNGDDTSVWFGFRLWH